MKPAQSENHELKLVEVRGLGPVPQSGPARVDAGRISLTPEGNETGPVHSASHELQRPGCLLLQAAGGAKLSRWAVTQGRMLV
jgi:hypothetical protein